MTTSGITRNIDEVGRLVIPREIRKSLNLKQGTPLQICVESNGDLRLKKISTIFNLQENAKKICKIIYNTFDTEIIVCDLSNVISVNGASRKTYINKELSSTITNMIEQRTNAYFGKQEQICLCKPDVFISNFAFQTIIFESNNTGAILVFNTKENTYSEKTLVKLANLTCNLLTQE